MSLQLGEFTNERTATAAWDVGFGYACRGFGRNVPRGVWFSQFSKDFLDGYDSAVGLGQWGSRRW